MDDQEVEIISSETRKERIKNFFLNNKKNIIAAVILFLLVLFAFFFYQENEIRNKERLANKYNATIIEYESGDKSKILNSMKDIIEDKDKTYSPLAFYYLLDNDLIKSNTEINNTQSGGRYSWFIRLRQLGSAYHPLGGIMRLETDASMPIEQARVLADESVQILPALSSIPGQDPRAPHNFVPVGRLEKVLTHRLGDQLWLNRKITSFVNRQIVWLGREKNDDQ